MKREEFTKKTRAQFNEGTRGQEYIALAALAASICVILLLGEVTQRALFIAAAIPSAVFAWLAYRTANVFASIHMPHRRSRAMTTSLILALLTVAIIIAQELYVRSKGVV
jgi:hypothetical protein